MEIVLLKQSTKKHTHHSTKFVSSVKCPELKSSRSPAWWKGHFPLYGGPLILHWHANAEMFEKICRLEKMFKTSCHSAKEKV